MGRLIGFTKHLGCSMKSGKRAYQNDSNRCHRVQKNGIRRSDHDGAGPVDSRTTNRGMRVAELAVGTLPSSTPANSRCAARSPTLRIGLGIVVSVVQTCVAI